MTAYLCRTCRVAFHVDRDADAVQCVACPPEPMRWAVRLDSLAAHRIIAEALSAAGPTITSNNDEGEPQQCTQSTQA